ncbi:hypothetical protein SNE26_05925 [Mucilaginibacter sp. cycad4]|nr:hypothetical protein [Mucilaginibacter gossypii]WPV01304.1 hypothetical protein SNE26_05925 [Mucilaginibacter gossypii]
MKDEVEEIDYDDQINFADQEIESGNFVNHEDVENLFQRRRENL